MSRDIDRWALPLTLAVVTGLTACHAYYVMASRISPSTDEAHYMTGALSIAEGIRGGTLSSIWRGYQNALGFKAPLLCVPAAAIMLVTGGLTLPSMLSLVVTFLVLGLASYSLFRRCVMPFQAAMATTLLLTTPMVTGLTHRFYVELLLVLIAVVYVDLLTREPWVFTGKSLALGLVLGLGVLCKISFPALVALPTLYSLWRAPRAWKTAWNVLAAGGAALAIAGSWYLRNWRPTLEHARLAASAPELYYPHWIQADISVCAWVVVVLFGVVGLGVVLMRLRQGRFGETQQQAWVMLVLLGLTTVFLTAITINKATRYNATALPMIAALAAAAWPENRAWARYGLAALAAASTVLALHNSFHILPVGEVRAGHVRILDDRFPLNLPEWYDDDHPLDRRDFRLADAERVIAQDAREHFPAGRTAEARTTTLGLLPNHDYFQLLAIAEGSPVHYVWWPGSVTSGPQAPDYIVAFEGFERIYPGVHFFNYYPGLREDVAQGKVPYRVLAHLEGPSETGIWIYARR